MHHLHLATFKSFYIFVLLESTKTVYCESDFFERSLYFLNDLLLNKI